MKRLLMAAIAASLFVTFANPAEAKKRHHHHHYKAKLVRMAVITPYVRCDDRYPASCGVVQPIKTERGTRIAYSGSEAIVAHPAGCPGRQFCGCGVSVKVFGHPVRDLYLASNWHRFPRAAPGPGMVAIWRHHVAYILSYDGNGNATLYDPNSGGHQTRIHQRDISRAKVVNPNSTRMAMR